MPSKSPRSLMRAEISLMSIAVLLLDMTASGGVGVWE